MLNTVTRADAIYKAIRSDILHTRLKPGDKLSELQLAGRFEVSRAPIRDAIRKLQQEGLVIVQPQVGTLVAPISLSRAYEICRVRVLLEPYAAEQGVLNMTSEAYEQLRARFDALKEAEEDSDDREMLMFSTDSLLHETLWRLSGNQEIYRILDGYRSEIQRTRLATAALANRMRPSEKEMWEILQAVEKRDAPTIGRVMRRHMENILAAVESILSLEEMD
jgi:GntR family transcriptional regulator, rspAB operon transcriptional repressor